MYRIKHGDANVECDSAKEAAELLKLLRPSAGGENGHKPPAPSSRQDSVSRPAVSKGLVLPFLRIVAETPNVTGRDVMTRLGLKGPRAMGSVCKELGAQLEKWGISADQVVSRTRKGDTRLWQAGSRLKEVIERMEKQ